jgi:hypothetical protein
MYKQKVLFLYVENSAGSPRACSLDKPESTRVEKPALLRNPVGTRRYVSGNSKRA